MSTKVYTTNDFSVDATLILYTKTSSLQCAVSSRDTTGY
jgi:hypothetical protein